MHFLFVVKVIAHICIHGDYPSSKPIVLIQLEDHKQGSTLTRLNSDVVLVCLSVCYALFVYRRYTQQRMFMTFPQCNLDLEFSEILTNQISFYASFH